MSTAKSTAARRGTAKKVVGSLGVIGAAAAVAGIGSFGTFTDSTAPVDTDVDTGVVSIRMGAAGSYASVPVVTGGLLPGDTMATAFDVTNDGWRGGRSPSSHGQTSPPCWTPTR